MGYVPAPAYPVTGHMPEFNHPFDCRASTQSSVVSTAPSTTASPGSSYPLTTSSPSRVTPTQATPPVKLPATPCNTIGELFGCISDVSDMSEDEVEPSSTSVLFDSQPDVAGPSQAVPETPQDQLFPHSTLEDSLNQASVPFGNPSESVFPQATPDDSLQGVQLSTPGDVLPKQKTPDCATSTKAQYSQFWTYWRTQRPRYESPLAWWELGKRRIKELCISFSVEQRKDIKSQNRALESRAKHLKISIDSGDLSLLTEYHEILNGLAFLNSHTAQDEKVRSRARWIEEGESSAFFLRLEKQHRAESTVDVIQKEDGTLTSDPDDLLSTWHLFYNELFSASETNKDLLNSFLSTLERKLLFHSSESCEGLLSSEECLSALRGMANNKTPGIDGLPKEFYITFWDIVGPDLVSILNHAFQAGTLSYSQRLGIIKLIYKKGPRQLCKNWRPISLLCYDYKIASRAISSRLRTVIAQVVSPDQTCCIPGRYIGENVRLLTDSILYADMTDQSLALLSLDQEKAFDRVDWPFMQHVLERIGFGPSFCG
ncbi:hypothetical protein QZH41_018038 [Actinostola sp. cb2023]|nr:hypothetical protein QZH41_018038 [Actinostola sp. cb2023]